MREHPDGDELVKLELELLDEERGAELRAHLAACERCRARAGEVAQMIEDRCRPSPAEPRSGGRRSLWRGWLSSPAAPSALIGLALGSSALISWFGLGGGWPLWPLVISAGLVVLWLHVTVARAESGWRESTERRWQDASPPSAEERALMLEGVRLSVVSTLLEARAKVTRALTLSLGLFILAAMVTLSSGLWAREVAVEVAAGRPFLLPGALALGVLLGGVVWSSWRLRRLALRVSRFFESSSAELTRGAP